jgi:hypothetical protein
VSSQALTRCWNAALAALAAFALLGNAVLVIKHGRSLVNFASYFMLAIVALTALLIVVASVYIWASGRLGARAI